jgi:carbamoyltransferase
MGPASEETVKIIGLSGLDNSVAFKRAWFPELEEREYRVTQGFDSAAVLLTPQGVEFAAAEERFTREKATGAFPALALEQLFATTGVRPEEIDLVAHGFDYRSFEHAFAEEEFHRRQYAEVFDPKVQIACLEERYPGIDWADRFVPVLHHEAHAASAFYQSGFDEALILVSDGMGEIHSMTALHGTPDGMQMLAQVPAFHSIGILYGVFTMYLGFQLNLDEYKIMGLAPYGDRRRYFNPVMDLVQLKDDGTYAIPLFAKNETLLDKETHRGVIDELEARFGPRRALDTEGMDQRYMDIAAALQQVLQTVQLHVARHFRTRTGAKNLCLAGGVALNCTANGVLKRSRLFKDIFVQPASGDDGSSLGAALYVQSQHDPQPPRRISAPLWGPEFGDDEIRRTIEARDDFEARYFDSFEELSRETARLLDEGRILSWFQGRMEFGPRALGNRSIIADPRPDDMRNRVNMLIKKREGFRPFAPAVAAEAAHEYFEIPADDPETFAHMLFVMQVRMEWREKLKAITHVDGSGRVQTVTRETNPRFHQLLCDFREISGIPMVLNTSFNVKGQPIVCTPTEAIDTFLMADLQGLVIGNWLLLPKAQR